MRFRMQKNGAPVWDQTTIDRLWVTTQREAMIKSGHLYAVVSRERRRLRGALNCGLKIKAALGKKVGRRVNV